MVEGDYNKANKAYLASPDCICVRTPSISQFYNPKKVLLVDILRKVHSYGITENSLPLCLGKTRASESPNRRTTTSKVKGPYGYHLCVSRNR